MMMKRMVGQQWNIAGYVSLRATVKYDPKLPFRLKVPNVDNSRENIPGSARPGARQRHSYNRNDQWTPRAVC